MDATQLAAQLRANAERITIHVGALGLGLRFAHGFARSCAGLLELDDAPTRGVLARLLLPTVAQDSSEIA